MRTKGAIASGHELTSEAGRVILEEGGNAFDAALAALLTTFVCEPCMSSAGGGGFLAGLYHEKPVFKDFFCQTPRVKSKSEVNFQPINVNFGAVTETFYIGKGSIAIPGNIAGVFSIHKSFCSLPLPVIAEFAIDLAKKGVIVNDFQEYDFKLLKPILDQTNDIEDVFYASGKLAEKGDLTRMEQFADFLDVLCREGERFFYEGEIARKIESGISEHGGFINQKDLLEYKVLDRAPIHFELNGFDVFTNPPPSAGGTILKLIFDNLWSEQLQEDKTGPQWLSLVCDTFQKVQEIRQSAGKIEEYQKQMYPKSQWGSTTHLSVVDEHGNAAAISTTNGQGSGFTVPGTQVMLNNMLGEGALFPLGFHTWEENTRVPSMMSPTVVRNPKTDTRIAMGTGGAGRIPYSIAQVMINLILGEGFGKAIDHPRVYLESGTLSHEPGIEIPATLPPMVNKVVSWEQNDMFFGGVHTVVKSKDKIKAIGDKRRHGIVEYVR